MGPRPKYSAARAAYSGESCSIPRATLHRTQSRPRTRPVSWQWSIHGPFAVSTMRQRQTAHRPAWASTIWLYSSTVSPRFRSRFVRLRYAGACLIRGAARGLGPGFGLGGGAGRVGGCGLASCALALHLWQRSRVCIPAVETPWPHPTQTCSCMLIPVLYHRQSGLSRFIFVRVTLTSKNLYVAEAAQYSTRATHPEVEGWDRGGSDNRRPTPARVCARADR